MVEANHYLATTSSTVIKLLSLADSPYTATVKDSVLCVDTTAGAVIINLPQISSVKQRPYTVLDLVGNAATNNIIINAFFGNTINGATSQDIASPYASLSFLNDKISRWNTTSDGIGNPVRFDVEKQTITIATSYTISKNESSILGAIAIGGGNDILILPDATTLANGWSIMIINDPTSTERLLLQDNTTAEIHRIEVNVSAHAHTKLTLCDNTTVAGVWVFQIPFLENTITVGGGGADFTSVRTAILSISGSSSTNRYIVRVGPGTYTEQPFVLPQYTLLYGEGNISSIIEANATTDTIITTSSNSQIEHICIRGASGVGGRAIQNLNVLDVTITNCTFENCETYINIASTSANTLIHIDGCYFNPDYQYGVYANSTGFNIDSHITNCEFNGGASIIESVHIEGPDTNIVISNSQIQGPSPAAGIGILVTDDPTIIVSGCHLNQHITGFHADSTGGSGPNITIATTHASNNTTDDILVENTNATGTIGGGFDATKVTIHDSATISLSYLDTVSGQGTNIVGGLNMGAKSSELTNMFYLINDGADMGIITGGKVTPSSTALTINVSSGIGYIATGSHSSGNHRTINIVWNDQTIVVLDDSTNYIHFNTSLTLVTSPSRPHLTKSILLGVVRVDSGNVLWIDRINWDSHHPGNKSDRYQREVFGPVFQSGSTVSNTSATLQVISGAYYHSAIKFTLTGLDTNVDIETGQAAQGGTLSTLTFELGSNSNDDFYHRYFIEMTSGPASGDIRRIIDYDGTTLIATVTPNFSGVPVATNTYNIIDAFTTLYDSDAGGQTFTYTYGIRNVDVLQYNDATAGTLVALAGTEHAKHALYVVGDGNDEKYFLQYGDVAFTDLSTAQSGAIPSMPNYFNESMVIIASIIVDGAGGTGIIEIEDQRPIPFTRSSVVTSGVSAHSALSGLLLDDHTQYLLVSGARAMGGDLNMGGNDITANIGNVDGVKVSLHAARHGATSVDPLPTAAPATISSVTGAPGLGSSNSFARADHIHDLNVDHVHLSNIGTNTHTQIDTHVASTSNPHGVDISDVSILTTKGDIFGYNTSTIRVGIGADETVLEADSAESSGIRWSTTIPNHIASSSNPHSVTKAQIGLGNVENLQVNLTAVINPVITDDSGSGYAVGSRWFNVSTDEEYVCLDASVGAAVWLSTTVGSVTGPGSSTDTAIVRWNGTGGDALQDSSILIDGSSNITGVNNITTATLTTTTAIVGNATGQILLSSSQAAGDAVEIVASNATGGIQFRPGTSGAVNLNRGALRYTSTGTITSTAITQPIPVINITVELTTTTSSDVLSLPDGVDDQILKLVYVARGASTDELTVTPDNFASGSAIVFTDLGDSIDLIYNVTGGWYISGTDSIVNGTAGGKTLDNYTYTPVTSSPYTVLQSDNCLGVDTSSAKIINLPLIATVGKKYYIITDITGTAGTFNITINCNGSDTVNGVSFVTISGAYNTIGMMNDTISKWFFV